LKKQTFAQSKWKHTFANLSGTFSPTCKSAKYQRTFASSLPKAKVHNFLNGRKSQKLNEIHFDYLCYWSHKWQFIAFGYQSLSTLAVWQWVPLQVNENHQYQRRVYCEWFLMSNRIWKTLTKIICYRNSNTVLFHMYLTRIWWIGFMIWITLVVYLTLPQFTSCRANFSIAFVTAANITTRSVLAGVLTWVWATFINCIYGTQITFG